MEGEGKQLQPIYVPAVQLPGQGVGPEAVRCPLISWCLGLSAFPHVVGLRGAREGGGADVRLGRCVVAEVKL